MKKCIYWHKKDFRLIDNEVLQLIATRELDFLPFYVWEDQFIDTYELYNFQKYAISQCLESVRKHYAKYAIPFLEVSGDILMVLNKLKQAEGFEVLVAHMEHGPQKTFTRDIEVKTWCKQNNVEFIELASDSVVRGSHRAPAHAYNWNSYMAQNIKPIPKNLTSKTFDVLKLEKIFSQEIKTTKKIYSAIQKDILNHDYPTHLQNLTEKNAILTLNDFLNVRGIRYRGNISSPNTALETGSRLSTYLAWGLVSSRYVLQATNKKIQEHGHDKKYILSMRSFISRLHWREHFIQKIENNPKLDTLAIGRAYRDILVKDDAETMQKYLDSFLKGQTGEPLVDACMRCLQKTGFINFRMRAMCVSYAFYTLHINWQILGQEMAKLFYDYEPGIHWYQIQMQTGIVGIHTVRVYSPDKQLLDQDPELTFIKKWLPELSSFTNDKILESRKKGLQLGTYPQPIVNFKERSKVMKDYIYGIKKELKKSKD